MSLCLHYNVSSSCECSLVNFFYLHGPDLSYFVFQVAHRFIRTWSLALTLPSTVFSRANKTFSSLSISSAFGGGLSASASFLELEDLSQRQHQPRSHRVYYAMRKRQLALLGALILFGWITIQLYLFVNQPQGGRFRQVSVVILFLIQVLEINNLYLHLVDRHRILYIVEWH